MTREIFISRYSPNRTDPEDLEAITVQKEELLSSAVESIRISVLSDAKHHLLLVGPRGAGKTHCITLIHHRISKMDDLKSKLRIAWLNEDETSDSLLSLLLRIHRTLSSEYAQEFPAESLESILDLTDRDAATHSAADLLLQQLDGRTLLIMLENLDALFRDMSEIEQKRWRALIQNHPRFCTLATAQRLFEGVSSQEEPFYGFFNVEHLKPFKVCDATDLLIKLAHLKKDPELAEFIGSPRGRARIRALHHLTGGNQRLFIILSDFINRESLDSLVGPFEELVDEQLTPYYQERLRWLPTLQRKIVEFLCAAHQPVPVKEIARQLFATHPTIAGQLRDLRKIGYVTSNQRGRESLYELSEPLMRLSYQVKDAKGNVPLRLLVDFLRVWYDHDDLTQRIKTIDPSATVTRRYLEAAISFNEVEGNLRHQYLREDADGIVLGECNEEELEKLRALADETELPDDLLKLGVALALKGRYEESLRQFTNVSMSEKSTAHEIADALFNRGRVHDRLGNMDDAIADYGAVIGMEHTPVTQICWSLNNRASIYGRLGKMDKAIKDFNSLIAMADVPSEIAALAHNNRGFTYTLIGKSDDAIKDFSAVIEMESTPVQLVAQAFVNRGYEHGELGHFDQQIADYRTAIQIDGATEQVVSVAAFFLGKVVMLQNEWNEAFALLKRVHVSVDERLREWFSQDSHIFIDAIFQSGQNAEAWRPKLGQLVEIYANNGILVELSTGLVNSIPELTGCAISPEGQSVWCGLWEECAKTYPELELGARLLKTGIAYLTSGKDTTTLLELPEEERRILAQALGLDSIANAE